MTAIVIDTETTGIVDPVIVQAAYVSVVSVWPFGVREDKWFSGRFNPGKPISHSAMAVHHIADEDVAGFPPASSFALPPDVDTIIGHNVDFDWRAIGSPPVRRICTLALAREAWPNAESHSLGAMLYAHNYPAARRVARHAHDAVADVRMVCHLLPELLAELGNPATIDDLWAISERARVPKVMPFGKHKGVPIRQVPADYRRWLLAQPDVDEYLRRALTA